MPTPERNSRDKNIWLQFGRYSHMALVLPASVVVGLAIGYGLDQWLKTSWLTLTGLLLGCVAGFVELFRVIMKVGKES